MGLSQPSLTPELQAFIEAQHVFFVATAPSGSEGHVNLSPKGLDTFRVLSPTQVAYLDITGSGNETAAHVTQNGRLTFMFCAFEGKPRILRLYGMARVGSCCRRMNNGTNWPGISQPYRASAKSLSWTSNA